MNDMDLDAAAAPLLHDPAYILQLYRRVSCALIKHEDDGRWRFAANFDMLDGRRERATSTSMRTRDDDNGYDPNAAFVALRTIFPSHTLSDKDVAVLLHVLPFDDVDSCTSMEDGALRPAIHGVNREAPPPPPMRRVVDVLRALRELLPWRAWQCAEAIRRGRAFMRAHHRTSSVAEVLRRAHCGEYASSSLCAIDVEQTLVEEAGLTASQAFLLLRYITTTNNNNNNGNTDEMDFDLLMKMLVADPMPSDVEYPLLAAQFAEATCAPMRGQRPATGSAALLLALENLRDRLEHIEGYDDDGDDDDDEDDLDFGNLMSRRISPRQLYELCHTLRVGFQQRDSDRLYSFLDVERRRCVSVAQLVSMFRRYFPPVSLSMLDLVQAAVVKLMKRSGDQLIFFSLYRRLHTFGIDAIPIDAFIRALRGSGVSEIVSDVELEWLRLSVPTRVGLIHRLCLPISARREGVLGQLFQRLCQDDALMLDSHTLLSRFQPHHVEADTIRRYAIAWRSALMDYVAELSSSDVEEERQSGAPPPPRVDITYDLFAFFWMMFSAAVEDDPTFSMLLWHSFVLADKQRAPR